MRANVRKLRIGGKMVFPSGAELELDASMVMELIVEEGADGALMPGDVLSALCTLDLCNEAGQWNSGGSLLGAQELIGATLMPELGAQEGGDTLWRSLGVYRVESALYLEEEGRLRLKCADSIASELGAAFEDGLGYPATLGAVWNHALGQTRYIWDGALPNAAAVVSTAPDWKGASLRSVLGWVAAAAGCFVRVDRLGGIELCPVTGGAVYGVDPGGYFALERDCASFGPVDALRITPVGGEERLYTGPGQTAVHALSVQGNPLFTEGAEQLDALAGGMLEAVLGYGGASLRLSWRGDPELRIGDRLEIRDTGGSTSCGVLSRQTLRFDGGFSASCSCAIPQGASSGVRRAITPEGGLNASALVGAVNGGLLSAGSVTTDKLAAGSVTAEKLAASVIETEVMDAVSARIEKLTSADIETDRLAAALAAFMVISAGSASFDRATVGHLVSEALNLEFGVGGQVFIKNLAVAYAQMVGATIGKLCIQASDGGYYLIDVDAQGNVTAAPASVSEGEIAAGMTDGGRVILGTNVTAESLNTSNLLATYALVNRIDAARIDVDEIFARAAFIDRLATSEIVAGKSLTVIAGEASSAKQEAGEAKSEAQDALAAARTGVASVDVQYYLSASKTSLTGGTWSNTAPEWKAGWYMWSRTCSTLRDGTVAYSNASCIAGAQGADGVSVTGITNMYLATGASSGVTASTAGWTSSVQAMDETKRYLWNYEIVSLSDGSADVSTPCIIGVYGESGADGRGISAVYELYALSDSASAAPASGWSLTPPTMTESQRYLWNYEIIAYTDGSSSSGEKKVIGVYGSRGADGAAGASGADGVGIAGVTEQYYLSTSKTSQTGGAWSSTAPDWEAGSYLWVRSVISYTDGSSEATTPIVDSTWELADEAARAANDAKDAADAAQNAVKDAVTRPEFERVVRIDTAGMHIGDNLTASEVLIDSGTVNIVVAGKTYSSFGANFLQLGDDIRIRRPNGGGVAFCPIKG